MKSLKSVKRFQQAFMKAYKASENVRGKSFNMMKTIADPKYVEKIDKIAPFFNVKGDTKECSEKEEDHAAVAVSSDKVISVISEVTETSDAKPTTKGWLKYKPDIEWKLDRGSSLQKYKAGLMVSSEGDVWDIMHDKLLPHKFLECEVKVILEKDCFYPEETVDKTVRVAPIVCRLFGVDSKITPKKNERVVIDYIDGDRRNLRPENLKWVVQKKRVDKSKLLADDVCRRLVENNGDVEKTLECYNSDSTITSKYISNIRFKLVETTLSDKYFKVDKSGNFTPVVSNVKEEKKQSEASVSPKEKIEIPSVAVVPEDILEAHIRAKKLSTAEKNLLLIKAINTLKAEKTKKITAEMVVDLVNDHYGIMLPTDMARNILGGMRI